MGLSCCAFLCGALRSAVTQSDFFTIPTPNADYDYTVVEYSKAMEGLIYEMARDHLVEAMAYPAEIKQRTYDPSFAIR